MNHPITKGLFITLDGPGGSGKSTLAQAITTRLRHAGVSAEHTTQPSPGPIGALARGGTHQFHGYALACLVAADRYHHLDTVIRPALQTGTTIVCDRYTPSSFVFQVIDGVEEIFITHLNQHTEQPDLAVFLTCRAAELRRRLTVRGSHGRASKTIPTSPPRRSPATTQFPPCTPPEALVSSRSTPPEPGLIHSLPAW